ncbi:AfsA-related hotdog domain-containing protein [Streptomyces sp. NPDC051180]|uniref:AfsA-related hotdog domain-containing protein n=1 Tax=Streptomyces sp. NPDC051180 TaxID=3155797 RepID=UPI00344F383D
MSIGVLQTVPPFGSIDPMEALGPLESLESLVREAKEGLSFDRTISRRLVHRASVTEVFLTDSVVAGADRFLVGAQLPRNHALYRPEESGRCDFMLLVETVRQAGIFLSHRYHDVPLGHHFIFKALSLHIVDPAALRVGSGPLAVALDVKVVTPAGTRTSRRFDARFDMVIEVGGRECARASAGVVVIDGVRYGRLRQRGRVAEATAAGRPEAAAGSRPEAAAGGRPGADRRTGPSGQKGQGDQTGQIDQGGQGGQVGQGGCSEVRFGKQAGRDRAGTRSGAGSRDVLRPGPDSGPTTRPDGTGEWRLHVDPTHPGYFEHPSDHVPGMLLLESFRQAAELVTGEGGVLSSMEAEFAVFGELAEPVKVHAARTEGGRIRLSATQRGRLLATAGARCA